ncbi:inactive Ufm1-specific protease 1 isoform X2 [Ixodes scapularis]|uniref:inactive Ufm1-specific protease 1 isoform X2 n=1 Tax=Ixodes scapularis TaxID=6945 RepID=UPI001A9CC22F|nr:inactive Ufm1-specific protease 1 isoform X2 [Ixodes scapularis]
MDFKGPAGELCPPALLEDVHENLPVPAGAEHLTCVKGGYAYYHYGCDGVNDRVCPVPSIAQIQEALVKIRDKPGSFLGSREWIGSVEASMCLDHFYEIPCKILHISSGTDLAGELNTLQRHFETVGSPVMMGGDTDASSKGILGVCRAGSTGFLLVLDPHWFSDDTRNFGKDQIARRRLDVQENGWISWRSLDSFMQGSFYNLCLPQETSA